MSLWGAVLGHCNLVYHAAGWQEGGLVASFEKLVLDVEMLQLMIEFLKPIVVDEAELGFEAQQQVAPGGHFFGAPHTMQRYEHAFYQPLVSLTLQTVTSGGVSDEDEMWRCPGRCGFERHMTAAESEARRAARLLEVWQDRRAEACVELRRSGSASSVQCLCRGMRAMTAGRSG